MDDGKVFRGDGTVIDGLALSRWKKYLDMFKELSETEMIHIIDSYGSCFDKHNFLLRAGSLDAERKHEKKYGKPASFASPLFMLLSVHVKPMYSSSLSVFGEILAGYGFPAKERYIYKREVQNAEKISLSDDGGYLTLNGPSGSYLPDEAYLFLQHNALSIRLHEARGQCLICDDIVLDYSEDGFEHVKDIVVQSTEISLTLKYVSIPYALYGCLDIRIFSREGFENSSNSVYVRGEVVAKYKNTLGDYKSEEIVLCDKNSHQYQRLPLEMLLNSRGWVAAPVYSSLHLHIGLFDSEEKSLLTEDVELETDCSHGSKEFISGEYFISVSSRWFNASRPLEQVARLLPLTGGLTRWDQEPTIEVFSVLVCYDKCTPLQIHGRLQFNTSFVSKDFIEKGFDIFKREAEVPLTLLGGGGSIPLLNDGSRILCNYFPVSLICDLKDIVGLNIKGYQIISDDDCLDRPLCSVFRGDHGFVAVHFSIFRFAAQAHLEVFVYRKGSQCAVSGSICAQYGSFLNLSQHEKKCYSIVFFKGREELVHMDADGSIPLGSEDLLQMDADGSTPLSKFSIPLSRTLFVVPPYFSSRFHVDLKVGTETFKKNIDVVPDNFTRSIKGEECMLKFMVKWSVC